MGPFTDKFGRRAGFMLSLLGSVFGCLAQGFAPEMITFIVFRTITGLLGGSPPIAQAYIVDSTTPEERPRYLAYTGAFMALAFIFGPLLGSSLLPLGLKTPFFAASGLAAIALILA